MSTQLKAKSKFLLLLMILFGCEKPDKNVVNILNSQPVINIGHAGSGFNYLIMPFNPLPPNSFASLKNALENGAQGVEVDLQITADNMLVLFHDKTTENAGLTGSVPSVNSSQLIGADYKLGFPYDMFQNEKVISFKQWISYAVKLKDIPYLQIDLKTSPGQTDESKNTLLEKLNAELREVAYPVNKVIVISGDQLLMMKLHNINPELDKAFEPAEFESGLLWAKANHCKYLILDNRLLTAEKVKRSHEQGIGVIAFGGKARSTLVKVINMKPMFIQSNHVGLVSELLQ